MAQYRTDSLENDHYYHIYSRSISKYVIFNDAEEYSRFVEIAKLYRHVDFGYQYSKFSRLDPVTQSQIIASLESDNNVYVEIIAFCIMPTHIHLLLRQIRDHGVSNFMAKILNCYSRYFNIKHKRTGPLWSGRFKNVLIKNDEQLLHLTRYIHLNPSSAGLIKDPSEWDFSSFNNYIDSENSTLLNSHNLFAISPNEYKRFVINHKDYQRKLSIIKSLIIEDYTG